MITDAASDAQFSMVALIALVASPWRGWSGGSARAARSAGSDAIRLVAVRGLGGKRLLALVEVERERFLLGLTDERIACLARVAPSSAEDGGTMAEQEWAKQSA